MSQADVNGRCPMGCGNTLVLVVGRIVCSRKDCPNPGAAAQLLEQGPAVRRATASLAEHLADAWWVQAANDLRTLQHAIQEPAR